VRLVLENISKKHGAQDHLYPLSLALVPGTINVLLGTTQAGKTTLMRVMAGLDRPTRGRVLVDDTDVTGVPVRQRNLAMVYQQFINYPSFSVFENIASPLRIQRVPEAEIRTRVHDMAERLHITAHLERVPAQLSGGQQQRCALARALIKNTELLLLDEPLVNLDYKLREELRKELSELFSDGRTTVVYATTEPLEALQLGGHIAVLHEGRLLQQGRTLDVFNAPIGNARLDDGLVIALSPAQRGQIGNLTQVMLGLRAHSLRLTQEQPNAIAIETEVDLSEISGSETYAHLHRAELALVAQLSGVHTFAIGARCTVYFRPDDLLIFDPAGALLFAPTQPIAGA
jgi:glycerol transport system ATP-binding protein